MNKPMIEKSSKNPAEITYVDGQLVYFAEFVFVNYIIFHLELHPLDFLYNGYILPTSVWLYIRLY